MNRSNGKSNQYKNECQGPQRDHPNDNVNRDVDFLGYRQSPMDWPALVEESLLKPLRELIRVEVENWGPGRR